MTAPAAPSATQVAAYRAGRDAFLAGQDSLVCPYPGGQPDPEGLRMAWIRGFVQTRRKTGQAPPQLPADDNGSGDWMGGPIG